jgi:hypothetical protein
LKNDNLTIGGKNQVNDHVALDLFVSRVFSVRRCGLRNDSDWLSINLFLTASAIEIRYGESVTPSVASTSKIYCLSCHTEVSYANLNGSGWLI